MNELQGGQRLDTQVSVGGGMRDHLDSGMKPNSNEYSKQVTLAPTKIVKIFSITTEAAEADDAVSP